MVRGSWNKIKKDDDTLTAFGYRSLHNLSISEMVYMFEAIGASIQKQNAFGTKEDAEIRGEKKIARTFGVNLNEKRIQVSESAFESFDSARLNLETIIPLIFHNSVIHYAIRLCQNEDLRYSLQEKNSKIGFAFCEPHLTQSSEIEKWTSFAQLTNDNQYWVANGEKCNVIAGDYDHYLVCCRSNCNELFKGDDGKPYPSQVLLLIPKEEISFEDDYEDSFGVKFQKLTFKDVKLNRDQCEVFQSGKDMRQILNMKGCAHITTSALMVGMMKQLLKNTYAHLVNEKLGLINCETVQYKLYKATSMIYSVESMLYMTAAMYDSFETGADLEAESSATKILATNNAYAVFQELRSIFGSRYPFFTTSMDLISSLDSMFETTLHTRLRIANKVIDNFAKTDAPLDNRNNFLRASVYNIKNYLKYRQLKKHSDLLSKEITKYVHHHFYDSSLWIESCVNRLEYSVNMMVNLFKKVSFLFNF